MSTRKYKSPPIEEALCEFTFLSNIPSQIDFTLPGKLQTHPAMKEYSGATRTQNIQTIAGPPNGSAFAIQDALFRIQLLTPDGTRLISIGADTLAVTVLRPYEGWEAFKPRIEAALRAYCEITGKSVALRVGVRYINRIVVPDINAVPAMYLNTFNIEHDTVGKMQNSFMHKDEYLRDDGCRVIVTQATLHPAHPTNVEYLLDIDTVWTDGQMLTMEDMLVAVERLHEVGGAVFENLITEKTRELFDAQ